MSSFSFSHTMIILAALTPIVYLATLTESDETAMARVVPMVFADARGAADWTPEVKSAFSSDEANQWITTEISLARRNDRGPQEWLPAIRQCRYISRFVGIMERYDLDRDRNEMKRLHSQRQRCYTQFQ